MEQKQIFTQTHAIQIYEIDYGVKDQKIEDINKLIQDVIDGKREKAQFYMKYKGEENIGLVTATHAIVVNGEVKNIKPLMGVHDGDVVIEHIGEFPVHYPKYTVLMIPKAEDKYRYHRSYFPKFLSKIQDDINKGIISEYKGPSLGVKYANWFSATPPGPMDSSMDDIIIVRKIKPTDTFEFAKPHYIVSERWSVTDGYQYMLFDPIPAHA